MSVEDIRHAADVCADLDVSYTDPLFLMCSDFSTVTSIYFRIGGKKRQCICFLFILNMKAETSLGQGVSSDSLSMLYSVSEKTSVVYSSHS